MTTTSDSSASESRPRLVCRIVRRWCAVSEAKPEHASTCASCRAYFAAADNLESALRHDASQSQGEAFTPTPAFEQQLLRAIRNSASDKMHTRSWRPTQIWTLGGLCAAAAAVAIVLSVPFETGSAQRASSPSSTPAEDAAVIISAVESLSTGLVRSVIPSAGQLVVQNPLQQELGSVYSDMRSALDFLALNFLPATRVDPPPEPGRRI